jgi:hypothetical protein
MKEIDFLPEWYKAGKQRRVNYRHQYIVVGGLFLGMLAWNFSAGFSISLLNAQVAVMTNSISSNDKIADRYQEFEDNLTELQQKWGLLDSLNPGVKISCVIGELSFLVKDKVTLTKLDIQGELLERGKSVVGSSVVRFSSGRIKSAQAMPEGDIQFKVTMSGRALNSAEVTAFISRLEKSVYFSQIVPGFMRNIKNSSETAFEISCYVGNYVEKE